MKNIQPQTLTKATKLIIELTTLADKENGLISTTQMNKLCKMHKVSPGLLSAMKRMRVLNKKSKHTYMCVVRRENVSETIVRNIVENYNVYMAEYLRNRNSSKKEEVKKEEQVKTEAQENYIVISAEALQAAGVPFTCLEQATQHLSEMTKDGVLLKAIAMSSVKIEIVTL